MNLKLGLRASKVGEQCEAIVKFPALFERFPFPILINSAFLKLSDVFRMGYVSNLMRNMATDRIGGTWIIKLSNFPACGRGLYVPFWNHFNLIFIAKILTRNNFQRLCVLKVTQQSEKHLDKILNTDEFLRRIFSVIHSNDPVARAITLRYIAMV